MQNKAFWKLSSAENILIRFIYLNVCDIIYRNVIKNRTRRIGAVQMGITAFNSEDKYYKSKNTQNNIDKIYICGGSSNIKGLERYVSSKLNMKVKIWRFLV